MTTHTFEWREWMSLFRKARVTIDHVSRTVEFIDAIRTKSFFNLLPIRSVTFSFDEIQEVKEYTENGHRCVSIETPSAKGVFIASDVPRFDEFTEQMLSVVGSQTD